MATTPPVVKANKREEFGKGAARRLRRDGQIPGVLYESGIENVHFSVDRIEMTALVRNDGTNAILQLEVDGKQLLCMVKHVDQNVLTLDIDHIDLLGVKRGEKVTVEVPVITEGEAVADAVVLQETDVLEIEVDALNIPDEIVVNIEGKEIGDQIFASDVALPAGAELTSDPEALVVNVTYFQEDEELEEAAAEAEAGGAEAGADADEDQAEGTVEIADGGEGDEGASE
ncbi:50S ribosomal protein L25/general stress protein Ctc [Corynebacterium sanguinis]|uniref:Large ribosomal subunit protein bL25 n=1 Tax=Corynebacterium sanguinis TaxID=2594913 RepID=A0A838WUG4_9CORY|nr:50S ribosomal protein L25/general stress protein Ctc [Corynebacterium sanguinis]MBA4505394.1 50S ribosomal protein L25/general stress protein Ctc [Corynebacterium sanguinis]MCT1425369.1 50S ribosomal protein L25/general stress protein Ctc [Corynebacterium sanguinis]MCT1492785.1 50S ribosomal protein L25/general stress protein Ctc [Corynebacterium sanguinis]MCT1555725.1 50S ribosomal protein L25/general stress protein Ctc [Corynebacterium sanguinis]MCT1585217.1 50S ribosomal protein L25/gene